VFFGFQLYHRESSSFGLAYISANLPTHALYGTAEEGTVEAYIRRRIMNYMNLSDSDYSMVFTASRGTAYKLLAESYPFNVNNRLLTVYDYESDAVSWMVGIAKEKGAKIMSASFKWPRIRRRRKTRLPRDYLFSLFSLESQAQTTHTNGCHKHRLTNGTFFWMLLL
jgi:hypothetical protein